MKWLLWSPAIALVVAALAVPGGIVFFAVPLLALACFLFSFIALSGSAEHHARLDARPAREQHEPASHAPTERRCDEKAAA